MATPVIGRNDLRRHLGDDRWRTAEEMAAGLLPHHPKPHLLVRRGRELLKNDPGLSKMATRDVQMYALVKAVRTVVITMAADNVGATSRDRRGPDGRLVVNPSNGKPVREYRIVGIKDLVRKEALGPSLEAVLARLTEAADGLTMEQLDEQVRDLFPEDALLVGYMKALKYRRDDTKYDAPVPEKGTTERADLCRRARYWYLGRQLREMRRDRPGQPAVVEMNRVVVYRLKRRPR